MRVRFILPALLFLTMTISGVFATWSYTLGFTSEQSTTMGLSLSVFDYPPEEVLPDDEESSEIGQNHLDLIVKILNEASYGLNATKKPIIHDILNKVGDVIYCEQNVQGGNLKHLMIDGTDAYALLFQAEYVSETEYITYTYLAADAKTYPIGGEIEVYKTIMQKDSDGVWTAPFSYYGKAAIVSVRTSNSTVRAIDSSTFKLISQ